MAIDRMKMADKHEARAVAVLGGRRTKASGSQWTDQGDGRNDHTEEAFAFAWDCKSTLAKSHTITTEMLDKLEEQSQGERPAMPLRWYADESLRSSRDWVLIRLDDLGELAEAVRGAQFTLGASDGIVEGLGAQVAQLEAELVGMAHRARTADERADAAEARVRELSVPHTPSAFMPNPVSPPPMNLSPLVPMLPWTSVFVTTVEGVQRRNGVHYTPDGYTKPFDVESVRVEPYGQEKRLFVNEQVVRHGDLWVDGKLDTRVGQG